MTEQTDNTEKNGRRFQFSIGTLICVTIAICVYLAIMPRVGKLLLFAYSGFVAIGFTIAFRKEILLKQLPARAVITGGWLIFLGSMIGPLLLSYLIYNVLEYDLQSSVPDVYIEDVIAIPFFVVQVFGIYLFVLSSIKLKITENKSLNVVTQLAFFAINIFAAILILILTKF